MINWIRLDPIEEKRTYHFANGKFEIENVESIAITESTHRLETTDGRKFIVPKGWLAIELVMKGWTL